MVSSILKLVSLVCCAVLAFSFAAFVSDQAGSGSKQTVAKIASADAPTTAPVQPNVDVANPDPATERAREKRHGALREKLDDANDVLTKPFAGVASSGSLWSQRIVSTLLAFLVFGVGLGFLGRYASTRGV
jgi:hypothetical protein